MRPFVAFVVFCLSGFLYASPVSAAIEVTTEGGQQFSIGPLPSVPIPVDNPMAPEKIELGKQLYFDPRLSGNNWISCATCHNPALCWADGIPLAIGGPDAKPGHRNSPTVLNAAYHKTQFWDGRAATLEEQALGPIGNPIEMFQDMDKLLEELNAIPGYVSQAMTVFGTKVTPEVIAKSIAAFERTLITRNSPFDRYMMGETAAMSEAAQRGMNLFTGKARCIFCHNGPFLSDGKYHNMGVPTLSGEPQDLGRYNVTKDDKDKGAFRTPSLRTATVTGPYLQNGYFSKIEQVIDFWDKGGGDDPNKDPLLQPIGLTSQEKADLLEFIKALSGEDPIVIYPVLPTAF